MSNTRLVRNNKTTWGDVFKQHDPDITEQEMDYVLWEFTSFPFGTTEMIKKDIEDYFNSKKTK